MRLSRLTSFAKLRKDQKFGSSRARKKNKRLDAICEKEYKRNHGGVKAESSECRVAGGSVGTESELRRSTRVRRAPVLLDASPPPPKKRRRIDEGRGGGSGGRLKREYEVKNESPCSTSINLEEEPDSWRSRLRSRAKNVSFRGGFSPRGKRKLFEVLDGFKEELKSEDGQLDGKKEGLEGGESTVVKSKRPGRIKASNVSTKEHRKIKLDLVEDEDEKNTAEILEEKNEEDLLLKDNSGCKNEGKVKNTSTVTELVEQKENEVPTSLELERCIGNDHMPCVEQKQQVEQLDCLAEQKENEVTTSLELERCIGNDHVPCVEQKQQVEQLGGLERENQAEAVLVGTDQTVHPEDGEWHGKPLEDEASKKVDEMICTDARNKPRMKVGRQCGLCGGGSDGKPPKKLLHDGAGSDNEACSGSSASEEPNYDAWDGFGDEPGWLGRLLGPINDRFGIAGIWVHQHCAVWSPEVYFAGLGCLKNVRAALSRGRVLKCSRCGRPGATIGCRVDRCPKTYHLPCARVEGCIFDHRKFLIACTDHRHLFQPHGSQYLHRLKKMKAKKMKLEMKKLSNDAWRRDLESEEKWLENCGEDEEFLKRESKRLHRDLLRIAPIYIGGSNCDSKIQFQGWDSVAGLQDVIQCLKEVVILPLLYPELFSNLGLTPPRGVLLHGYPGTGKTLVVRALIGSCARGDKQIAYFARKGADCLGKYVGDAERQLRLLFHVAEKSQPSIIFFDEIDGLAPSRTRQQDQTHNSVVSTLLALLDGLKSRGSVVVIGATNRPDAVDPALRRPGRFDREIYFPLPSIKDREAIISLHTQKWPKPINGPLLKWVARRTTGFAGADLQALCTQAAIIALKRSCRWQELLSVAGETSHGKRPPLPPFTVKERDWLEALSAAPPSCFHREAGMAANDVVSSPLQGHLIPCLLQPLSTLLVSLYLDERLWLPQSLFKAAMLIKNIIFSALDRKKVQNDDWWSHVHDLLQEADVASEIESNLSHASIVAGDTKFSGGAFNDDTEDSDLKFGPCRMLHRVTRTSSMQNMSYAHGKRIGFRILLSGNPRSGQKHLASCLLHCFAGNIEIRKVDLATISQEGHGDAILGITQILMRCSSVGKCMIFMPRIDLWAIETRNKIRKESGSPSVNCKSFEDKSSLTCGGPADGENKFYPKVFRTAEMTQDAAQGASYLWSSFVEQVESIGVSTSLTILATSEVPFPALPFRISQFFKSEITNCSLLTSLEDTVPRFSIQVDGNFNHDMAIDSSAAKLSKDLAQQFIQLIHYRNHIHSSVRKDHKVCDTIEDDAATICPPMNPDSTIEEDSKAQCPLNTITRISLHPNNKHVKGKSSLLLATSTFGHQILRYPHFAELCWVTSKLKEGPSADINGPWKGWPFNSCVVHPNNSSEKAAVACGSSNTKSKETSGLVRGLVAVGLLAYRGVYTSLREVSLEVRQVLELLVGRINAKIQAGKDRYQFIRLLSQVACLEDMVNSWAYTLQSLEVDAQITEEKSKVPAMGSLYYNKSCNNSIIQNYGKPYVTGKSLQGSEVTEESTQGLDAKSMRTVDLTEGEGNFSCPNSEGRVTATKGDPSQRMVLHHATSVVSAPAASLDDLGVQPLNERTGISSELYRSENYGSHSEVGGDLRSSEQSNGFACPGSVFVSQDGCCVPGDLDGGRLSSAEKKNIQDNGFWSGEIDISSKYGKSNFGEHNADINLSSNKSAGLPTDSGVACFYHCCSKCLYNLHHLIQKILIDQWGLKGSDWTVEDVHDVVASLSVDLQSTLRKFCLAENLSYSCGNLKHNNCGKLFECREMDLSLCKYSGNRVLMQMECNCHSRCEKVTAKADCFQKFRVGLDPILINRDGVVVTLDPDREVSFHCKLERLCLCSLIEWVAMTKQPLD